MHKPTATGIRWLSMWLLLGTALACIPALWGRSPSWEGGLGLRHTASEPAPIPDSSPAVERRVPDALHVHEEDWGGASLARVRETDRRVRAGLASLLRGGEAAMVTVTTVSKQTSAVLSTPASAAGNVRIGIMLRPARRTVVVSVSGPCVLRASNGAVLARRAGQEPFSISASAGRVCIGGPNDRGYKSYTWIRIEPRRGGAVCFGGRTYAGRMLFRSLRGTLLPVNELELDEYVMDVLAAETPNGWPFHALAAQAVACRSFTLAMMGRHAEQGFDLCNLSHCQVYRGRTAYAGPLAQAVTATAGRILLWRGRPAAALFHSCCGGATAAAVGRPHPPGTEYLQSVNDVLNGQPACRHSPHFRWTAVLTEDEVRTVLRRAGWSGQSVRLLLITARDRSGRAIAMAAGGAQVDAVQFWLCAGRMLGRTRIPSLLFSIAQQGRGFVFTGRGYGHGAGLCQWGAREAARQGMTWPQILARYYPNLQLSSAPPEL